MGHNIHYKVSEKLVQMLTKRTARIPKVIIAAEDKHLIVESKMRRMKTAPE